MKFARILCFFLSNLLLPVQSYSGIIYTTSLEHHHLYKREFIYLRLLTLEGNKMIKVEKSRLYPLVILGMLLLLVSSGIYVSCPPQQSLQGRTTSPNLLYTTAETPAWNITWGGAGWERGFGVAVDASGAVYCVGDTSFRGGDFALVKVAPNGTRLWNTTWGGAANEKGNGVAVDASGAVYCIGYTSSVGGGDFALVKVAPNGTQLWNITWGGANYDGGTGVAVDASGAVYCVGDTNSFGAGVEGKALV